MQGGPRPPAPGWIGGAKNDPDLTEARPCGCFRRNSNAYRTEELVTGRQTLTHLPDENGSSDEVIRRIPCEVDRAGAR
jgi:hypothetical protein